MRRARVSKEALAAVAALLCLVVGARLLAGDARPPTGWSYVAAALGCAHAAALGALTIIAGRRATAAAWAPALLWPLAGPATVAAALAALISAAVIASRLRVPGRAAVATALGVAALGVLVGAASATERAVAPAPDARMVAAGGDAPREAGGDKDAASGGGDAPRETGGGGDAAPGGGDDAPREAGGGDDAAPGGGDDGLFSRAGDASRGAGGRPGPGATVRAYYRALDARRFERAWQLLTPAVQASFGGFATWQSGFGATRSSRPEQLRAAATGDEATVGHLLAATDATPCGLAVRRFALSWTLRLTPAGWRATAVTGRLLSEAPPPPCG